MLACPAYDLDKKWYASTFYVMGCITFSVNILAAYVIIRKSTVAMKDYRWYLLGNHLTISILDFHTFFLNVAEVFFPFTIGLCNGVLPFYNYLPLYQTSVQYGLIAAVLTSTYLLYFYRWQVLLPNGHRLYMKPSLIRFYVIFTYCWIMLPSLYFNFQSAVLHDNIKAKKRFENFTCLIPLLDKPGLGIAVPEETQIIMPILAVQMILGVSLTSLKVMHIIWIIYSTGSFISAETKLMQKKFLISLNIQVCIPAIILVIPASCIIYLFFYQVYGYQDVGNIFYVILSCHGIVSTITMMMVNEPYRVYIFTTLRLRPNVIATIGNSQNTSSNLNPSRSTV